MTQTLGAMGTCPFTVDRPVMRQRWERLTFLHWPFEAADVQRLLPDGLDAETHDGAAWVGLVPFYMRAGTPGGRRAGGQTSSRHCPLWTPGAACPAGGLADDGPVETRDQHTGRAPGAGECPFTVDAPVMRQRWERLTFLHWSYHPDIVQQLLPPWLRAGVQLAALIPAQALDRANAELSKSGVPLDLTQLKPAQLEALVEHLDEMTVEVDAPDAKVHVFCE